MRNHSKFLHLIFSLIYSFRVVFGTEFTFDLKKNIEECFYEVIDQNVSCDFEFQVVSGGALDVDVIIESPSRQVLYKVRQKEFDTINFNTSESGHHLICFYNKYSTYNDKSIFMSFEAGKKNQILKQLEEHDNEMTFMEATSDEIHNNLENILDFQTHYRMQGGHGHRFARDLNDRVLWWSLTQTFLILIIGISQVLILRKFFEKDPRPNKSNITLAHHINVYG